MRLFVIALLGCRGDAPPGETSLVGECAVSWEGEAQPALTTWCAPCHSSELTGGDRRGAPDGMDFDTWASARVWAPSIATAVALPDARMPPADGMSDADREALIAWAACGGPGDADPVDPCAEPTERSGDATTVDCSSGAVTVSGNLTLTTDAALDCICGIDGDLRIRGGAVHVSLPELRHVGGDLVVEAVGLADLTLPALARVDQGVRVAGAGLRTLDLEQLAHVGGAVTVERSILPEHWGPTSLTEVTELRLQDVAGLQTLELPRLVHVRGDITLRQLWDLEQIRHSRALRTVEGSLTVLDNPALIALEDFARLERVGGDVLIGLLPSVTRIEGLYWLNSVGGYLHLHDVPALATIAGFGQLAELGGTLAILDNGALADLDAFQTLERVGGDLVVRRNASLSTDRIDQLVQRLGDGLVGTVRTSGNAP